ncbi:hypothetical protein MJO28_008155 [Puccinia striiformis f. sp. tritici]|uniref:Uncharacterized protein n=1 Tax=Puccinia striiformis f. sp. tritici TaxID=168172 RepID=A0ACC0EAJ8_9BASI|nr:hypothetical protein MJO28_008155 [Puccinia striiformis f. sp. tritici]
METTTSLEICNHPVFHNINLRLRGPNQLFLGSHAKTYIPRISRLQKKQNTKTKTKVKNSKPIDLPQLWLSKPQLIIKLSHPIRSLQLEPICLILILNYINQICKNLVNFTISSLTVYRFCITLVTIGPKCTCNSFYSNLRYAQTTNKELNKYYLLLVESHPSYKIDRATATTNNQQSMMMITSNKKIDQEMAEEGGRRMEAGIKQIGRDD